MENLLRQRGFIKERLTEMVKFLTDNPTGTKGITKINETFSDFMKPYDKILRYSISHTDYQEAEEYYAAVEELLMETKAELLRCITVLKSLGTADTPNIGDGQSHQINRRNVEDNCFINTVHFHNYSSKNNQSTSNSVLSSSTVCAVCRCNHSTWKCFKFKKMKIDSRRDFAIYNNLNNNCLSKSHNVVLNLNTTVKSLLDSIITSIPARISLINSTSEVSLFLPATISSLADTSKHVIDVLPIAVVYAKDISEDNQIVRIMNDTRIESYLTSGDCYAILGRPEKPADMSLNGLSDANHFMIPESYQINEIRASFVLTMSDKDKACENDFKLTHNRIDYGRIPIKIVNLKYQYKSGFVNGYISLGHMGNILDEAADASNDCYMSYHSVSKSESISTMPHVFFDASAKSRMVSLNSKMLDGPIQRINILYRLQFVCGVYCRYSYN